MDQIFISYNNNDTEIVKKVSDKLKNNYYNIWIDIDHLKSSDSFMDQVEKVAKEIQNSSLILFFISNKYSQSENCKRELNDAVQLKKKCIYILLEHLDRNIESNKEIEFIMSDSVRLNAFKYFSNNLEEFCEEIFKMLEPKLKPIVKKKIEKDTNIFVSYHHVQKNVVFKVTDRLLRGNYSVWIDRDRKLKDSDSISNEIKQISDASIAICFIDKDYMRSENAKLEFDFAQKVKKKCIYIMLEKLDISESASDSIRLDAYKFSSFDNDIEEFSNDIYRKLESAILSYVQMSLRRLNYEKDLENATNALEFKNTENFEMISLLKVIASCNENLGRLDEAIKYFKILLETQISCFQHRDIVIFDTEHPELGIIINEDIVSTYKSLARILLKRNLNTEALEYLLRILYAEKHVFGEASWKIIELLNEIGELYYSKGLYKVALKYFTEALEIRENLHLLKANETTLENEKLFLYEKILFCKFSNKKKHILKEPICLPCGFSVCKGCFEDYTDKYKTFNERFNNLYEYSKCNIKECDDVHSSKYYSEPIPNAYLIDLFHQNIKYIGKDAFERSKLTFKTTTDSFENCKENLKLIFDHFENELEVRIGSLKSMIDVLEENFIDNVEKWGENLVEEIQHQHLNLKESNNILKCEKLYKKVNGYIKKLQNKNVRSTKVVDSHLVGSFTYNKSTEHADLVESYKYLAQTYDKLERYNEAIEYYKKAFEMQIRLFGLDTINNATILMNIGLVYSKLDNETKAVNYKLDALEILKRLYTEDTKKLSKCFCSLADSYIKLKDPMKYYFYIDVNDDLVNKGNVAGICNFTPKK